jgi:hypothetical protein
MRSPYLALILLAVSIVPAAHASDPPVTARKPKDALQPFNLLIGSWRGTGQPEGTLREKQKGFWTESLAWQWQFKGDDAWLKLSIDKGKHFTSGELRYLPAKDSFELSLQTVGKEKAIFTGALKDKLLTLDKVEDGKTATQRIIIYLLRDNRFLYSLEEKREGKADFARVYQVGATKEGVPFAGGDGKPVCIVSGGLGNIPVSYKGKTYYVCCSGCRDEFKEDPEKYVKEFEAKSKAAKP